MSGYRRKMIYLKRFVSGGDGVNVGFAKLEYRGGYRRITVQIKEETGQGKWRVYMGREEGDEVKLSPIGELAHKDGNLVFFSQERAEWTDDEIILLSERGACISEKPMTGISLPREEPQECDCAAAETVEREEEILDEMSSMSSENFQAELQQEIKKEEPVEKEMKDWAQNLFEKAEEMYPFEDSEWERCVKLDPRDFGMLPSEYWSLGSNSFLLNGYYSYRHLLFAEKSKDGKRCHCLGVPGVFHRREIFMARMFGFPRFKAVQDKPGAMLGDFGYWMMEL